MALPLLDRFEPWTPDDIVTAGIEKRLVFSSRYGALYEGDCLNILPFVNDRSVDTIFADPPFNLAKEYGSHVDDSRPDGDYITWCREWLDHCVRILKPEGLCSFITFPGGTSFWEAT